jgi:hypothetical protein
MPISSGTIPIASSGPSALPSDLADGNESFTVSSGSYVIFPLTFNCRYRYEPLLSQVTANVSGGGTTVVVIEYLQTAQVMAWRTWNDGVSWRVPLGLYPDQVDLDGVQFRVVGEQGAWLEVNSVHWSVTGSGNLREVRVNDYLPVDLEFRLIKRGFRNGVYQVVYAWYPPYTCGYDSCVRPGYSLIDSPLN